MALAHVGMEALYLSLPGCRRFGSVVRTLDWNARLARAYAARRELQLRTETRNWKFSRDEFFEIDPKLEGYGTEDMVMMGISLVRFVLEGSLL